ncbi:ATP-binding protein [Brevundimonas sp. SL161]|uniref:ATP-binding protein n=1 Tax=Brevundimonas sp. SL161 TaxID=2804613 RepID=UPI003CEA569E
MQDRSDLLDRLERRLQREHATRLAAEAIAEISTRELFVHAERLQLLETIAAACNLCQSPAEALKITLEQVCRFTGWPVGHAYVRRGRGRGAVMASEKLWWALDEPEFCEISERSTFPAGVGLPGRVMADKAPIWVTDATVEATFLRAEAAKRCGLRAAFGFPVLVGEEVAVVLEFCSYKVEKPDESMLRIMTQIGAQLGRVIERDRAEAEAKVRNAKLVRSGREAQAQRVVAEAANRAKSVFLAVTSHEVRTPLNAVLGLTEGLARTPLSPHQQTLVNGVLESGGMLMRLLNAVLHLAQIEAGKMSPQVEVFDLRRTIEATARVWRPRAQELGVELVTALGALPDDCCIVSDLGKVEQTMINLLSNALKFSPPDSQVVLAVGARRKEGRYMVSVEVIDQGPGIVPADRARIFQAFEQTDAGRQAGGAGLGLAICAGNIASLNGTIGHDPTTAGGSRFWFEFPADVGSMVSGPIPKEPPATQSHRPLRILAAEDNAANRHVLRVLLDPLDVELSLVEDGEEAVKAISAGVFDIILMDANMPRMDGVTAVRGIRALTGYAGVMPIFMLTANVFEADVHRYHAAGVDGVLKKPIDVAELFAVLGAAAARIEPLDVSVWTTSA